MSTFGFSASEPLRILALGAHPDDIEIGAAGTLLRLLDEHPGASVDALVFTASPERRAEALESYATLTGQRQGARGIIVHDLRDGLLPADLGAAKAAMEECKAGDYDLVIGPALSDAHQDHRTVAELAWQTFRRAAIWEYEIPKYEGIREQPNLFVALDRATCERKIEHLRAAFPSQHSRSWWDPDTFWALLRLRGVEGASPTGYAEAFVARKVRL